jgi:serine/threonine protein kinase/predicted Zn-dependent protease
MEQQRLTSERWRQVKQIFQAAIELAPAERAPYFAEVCADDPSLRAEIESLIAAHQQPGSFMNTPAVDLAAEFHGRPLLGQSLGHYRVLSLLGKGGMGEVYLAEDTRLNRRVALKLLPAEFTREAERVRRFIREARAASALNHPNIITIHEIGQASPELGGIHFIAEEFVEGQTLRQRLAGGRMKLDETIEIASQIAAALGAAHEAGIVHRDIKPENVMLRRDGYVKVLDFGLAKLTERGREGETERRRDGETLSLRPSVSPSLRLSIPTDPGVVMGTASYMSPEQARGQEVDNRSDIFSLGVVLYEMVTGHPPFRGAAAADVISAILNDDPAPLSQSVAEAPEEIERIVAKALRKDREERYQNVEDLLLDLKDFRRKLMVAEFGLREMEAGTRDAVIESTGHLSIHNRRSAALVVTVLAALAIAAAWFYFSRAPVLTDKDAILLADFDNRTGDEVFDGTLRDGLAVQLGQSPFLALFPDLQVRQTLRLMNRSPDDRVTDVIAQEIRQRQGLKAFLTGSISGLGSHYVITPRAVNAQTGDVIASEQVEAESKERVPRTLSQAASRLRKELGESLSSIRKFDAPLDQTTTSSLEALKFFSLGREQNVKGKWLEAIPFFKRATELDQQFASAYSTISILYYNSGQPGLSAEFAARAFALRDRASEIEKLRITLFYYSQVTGELDKTIETLKLYKRTYPRDHRGPTFLSDRYLTIGQFEQAVAEAREAVRVAPNSAAPALNLAEALLRLNQFAEARQVYERGIEQQLDATEFHTGLYQIAFIDGDAAAMRRQLDWASGKPDEYVALDWQAQSAAFDGQWRRAREFSRRAVDLAAHNAAKEVAARYATEQALRGVLFGDCRSAGTEATKGLNLARGRSSLPRAALAAALRGDLNRAKSLVDEMLKEYSEDTIINSIWLPMIRSAMEMQRGAANQAIEQLQTPSRYEAAAEFWPPTLRGQAYLKLGRGAEAASEFQKIPAARGQALLSALYPLAHLGLARAAAVSGDRMKARQKYQDFFAAWKDADADLPVLIEARKESEKLR